MSSLFKYVFVAVLFSVGLPSQAADLKTSGVYLTAADYQTAQLSLPGVCGSGSHKLELHDVTNKPYIDVTHDHEKRRYAKTELFGFRACDGHDYRLAENFEYRILEAKELYIYVRDVRISSGKTFYTRSEYYFSLGPQGQIRALTPNNLKQAFPDNHKFHDSLDMMFGTQQNLALYDDFHKMFKVNRLLIASREKQP